MTLTKTENIMETKFTKGEWYVFHGEEVPTGLDTAINSENGRCIGWVYGDSEQGKSNAKLIAAAPDMYEALKLVIEICEVEEKNKFYGQNEKHWTNVVLRAFKKATN